jgi:rhodanese-related sulfurtransferase
MNDVHSNLPDPEETIEIGPHQVANWIGLPADERPILVDCREADEVDLCRIDGHVWIPLGQIPEAIGQLESDAARGIVVYCHHGMRSRRAAEFLRSRGLIAAFSMSGGIDLWSQVIDPSVPRY